MQSWQMQAAKARLSEVVKQAQASGPVEDVDPARRH